MRRTTHERALARRDRDAPITASLPEDPAELELWGNRSRNAALARATALEQLGFWVGPNPPASGEATYDQWKAGTGTYWAWIMTE